MRRHGIKRGLAATAYLTVAAATVGSSGCLAVAAGVAAGGAAGYMYARGRVCDIYATDLETARGAVRTAVADLGMTVEREDAEAASATLYAHSLQGESIKIDLKPTAPVGLAPTTRICVRVKTFGDHPLSEQIHAQIAARLGVPAGPLTPVPAPTAAPPLAGPAPAAVGSAAAAQPKTAEPPLAN